MAVKASYTITLSCYRDTQSVTQYYLLQSSTSDPPNKPEKNPPPSESGWTKVEPSYEPESTNNLYVCYLTVFSDGTHEYSEVSKSSSYEAAKEAYNKAIAAGEAASDAAKVATNYMNFSNAGLVIGDMTSNTLGRNVCIDSDSVDIRDGTKVLASYGGDKIYLGKDDASTIIDLCCGTGVIKNTVSTNIFEEQCNQLTFESSDNMKFVADEIYLNIENSMTASTGRVYNSNMTSETTSIDIKNTESGTYTTISATLADGTTDPRVYYISKILVEPKYISFSRRYQTLDANGISDGTISTPMRINMETNLIEVASSIVMNNGKPIFAQSTDGTELDIMSVSGNNNTVIGYGGYENKIGRTHIYGTDVRFTIGDPKSHVTYYPYYKAGDSVSLNWYGAGHLTSGKKGVRFSIPLSKPIIGSPTITVASVSGLILRQNGSYTHGSGSTTYVKPDSYSAAANSGNYVRIIATMSDTTNAVNNSPIGVEADIKITFS